MSNPTRLKKKSEISKPFFEKWFGLLIVLALGFVTADLLIIAYRDLMLQSELPQVNPKSRPDINPPTYGSDFFYPIVSKNVFSASEIPPELVAAGADPKAAHKDDPPIPTTLPLGLVGTLVHSNPAKSIAAIEVKSKTNQVLSYSVGRTIESLALVEKIERGKVIIRNVNTGKLEFLEIKTQANSKVSFGTQPAKGAEDSKDVRKIGANKFEISRADLNKYTADLSSVLMKARAVPARRPGSGEIYGWRLLEMEAGSIFDRLGLQVMDTITSVNGNPVTSAQQAMEMYQALKNSSAIKIQVERGGKMETLDYAVTQ